MSSSTAEPSRRAKNWLPLESNPDLMNKYIGNLGVPSSFQFVDVYGTDEELLDMVPQPVYAVLLLYPITASSEAYNESSEPVRAQAESEHTLQLSDLFYMKQTVGNACGTIGVIHAVSNTPSATAQLDQSKWLHTFLTSAQPLAADARATLLEQNDDIEAAHQSLATEATSDVNHSSNDNLHFIALVEHNGLLVELDGRRGGPVVHGPVGEQGLLRAAVRVVQQYTEREPGEIRFNMTALTEAD